MKKILCIFLIIVMTASLIACGTDAPEDTANSEDEAGDIEDTSGDQDEGIVEEEDTPEEEQESPPEEQTSIETIVNGDSLEIESPFVEILGKGQENIDNGYMEKVDEQTEMTLAGISFYLLGRQMYFLGIFGSATNAEKVESNLWVNDWDNEWTQDTGKDSYEYKNGVFNVEREADRTRDNTHETETGIIDYTNDSFKSEEKKVDESNNVLTRRINEFVKTSDGGYYVQFYDFNRSSGNSEKDTYLVYKMYFNENEIKIAYTNPTGNYDFSEPEAIYNKAPDSWESFTNDTLYAAVLTWDGDQWKLIKDGEETTW